jgi:lipopolysaccharide transport system ATP-binding protein
VAAHLDTDIMILDEVLAVGDLEFQNKCLGKMDRISKNDGKTILFVSHGMGQVEKLCNQIIYLRKGEGSEMSSNVTVAVERYKAEKSD